MLNSVTLMGRMVADPCIREATREDGKVNMAAQYRLAIDSDIKGQDPVFVTIKTFGSAASFIRDYVKKGDLIVISGRLAVEVYEKDGEKVYFTLVYANRNYLAKKKTAVVPEDYPERILQPGKDRTGGQCQKEDQEQDPQSVPMPEYEYMPEIPEDIMRP